MLLIEGKALGRKKPLFSDWSIPLPPSLGEGNSLLLRELIRHVVHQEVEDFKQRQESRSILRALTAREIDQAAARGKVDAGGHALRQAVDVEQAVAVALQAFEDGLYLVVVDGTERRSLEEVIVLTPESRVAFVRLTLLAGG